MNRLARIKKALHLSKTSIYKQPDTPASCPVVQNIWNFNFDSTGVTGGYTCPSPTTCGLCRHFSTPAFIYQLFTSKYFVVGQTTDLFAWSRESECPLCMYLCVKFVDATKGQIPLDAQVVVRWNTRDSAVKGGRRDEVRSWDFDLETVNILSAPGAPYGAFKTWPVAMDCWTEEDQKMGYYVTTRPANLDIGAPAAFEKAKSWLDECMQSHPKCQRISPAASQLPTRVLEISSTGDNNILSIRLYSSSSKEVSPYAALSYVWGGPQAFCTLQSNIASHISGISLSTLPQTIQDAVLCAHKLGLKYLWVDSLCIIQDSTEDREREIAHMAQIYKNAFVTITAAGAKGCHEGFLGTKGRVTIDDLRKQSFKINVTTPKDPEIVKGWIEAGSGGEPTTIAWDDPSAWNSQASTIYLALSTVTPEEGAKTGSLPIKDLLTAHSIDQEVISSRGWTFQESWLSPRTLIYGSSQLLFDCSTHIQSDGGLSPSHSSYDYRDDYRTDINGHLLNRDGTQVTPERTKEIYTYTWRKVVQEASRRNLTVAGDKLFSLAGIAQEITLQTGYAYLAGMWRETLLHDLSWHQRSDHRPIEGGPSLNWTQARHCSSWTWIKTDGPISFSHAEYSSCDILHAEILQQEMELDVEDQQEKLTVGGPLRLRAPISSLPLMDVLPHFQIATRETPHKAFQCTIFPDGGLETNPHLCYPKTPTFNDNGKVGVIIPPTMRFLELSYGKTDGVQNIAAESRGLVIMPLERAGTEGVYRRIGFYVVALEEDSEWKIKGLTNMMMVPGAGAENVLPTAFGRRWKEGLRVEEVTIV